MNILLEKKGKVPDEINIRGNCSRVYQNVLLPDGSLSLCCQDYGLDEIMGNLLENTWEEYQGQSKTTVDTDDMGNWYNRNSKISVGFYLGIGL